MWGSSVPDAVDGLVAVLKQADLDDCDVIDGLAVGGSSRTAALTVGAGSDDDPTAVDGSSAREGLGGGRDREQYGIRCVLEVSNGSGDLPATRRRAYALMGTAGDALAANQTLNGAVLMASLGVHGFSQDQDERGAIAIIAFTVDIDAFSKR